MADTGAVTVHRVPLEGEAVTLCCGMTPFELPYMDRLTLDADLVTCNAPAAHQEGTVNG